MIFNQFTEEPKYQAEALTVVTDTIKTAGAAIVVTGAGGKYS